MRRRILEEFLQKVETDYVLFLHIRSTGPVCEISEWGAWNRWLKGKIKPDGTFTDSLGRSRAVGQIRQAQIWEHGRVRHKNRKRLARYIKKGGAPPPSLINGVGHEWLAPKRIVAAERFKREMKKRYIISVAMANVRNLDTIGY